MKRPSGPDAICTYLVERGEAYWNNCDGATTATYLSFFLLANHLDVPEEVDIISDQGESRVLPWYEVQQVICEALQAPKDLVSVVMNLLYEVEDDDMAERLSIGDDCAYSGRDEFSDDIDWDRLYSDAKHCWHIVSINSQLCEITLFEF